MLCGGVNRITVGFQRIHYEGVMSQECSGAKLDPPVGHAFFPFRSGSEKGRMPCQRLTPIIQLRDKTKNS